MIVIGTSRDRIYADTNTSSSTRNSSSDVTGIGTDIDSGTCIKLFMSLKKMITSFRHYTLFISIAICILVNVITIYIFRYRPFTWHDGSVARFMY